MGVTRWVCPTVRGLLPTKAFPRGQQKDPAQLSLHLGLVKISSILRDDCPLMQHLFGNSLHFMRQAFSETEEDQSKDKNEDEK